MNIGYEMEEGMEDEDDLEKWENKELTTSDLKILLTNGLEK